MGGRFRFGSGGRIRLEWVVVFGWNMQGRHVFYRHPDGRTTTLPNHPGRDLARPLVREILRESELAPGEFVEKLKNL
ncbi:MAG TPA: addiction module toxin, HicA family [Desulfotomaculum sp.]|nr:addiction module toxin, HicA family [Desulfotomaculum sp.]